MISHTQEHEIEWVRVGQRQQVHNTQIWAEKGEKVSRWGWGRGQVESYHLYGEVCHQVRRPKVRSREGEPHGRWRLNSAFPMRSPG